jgi:retron-type reverse transcriptase
MKPILLSIDKYRFYQFSIGSLKKLCIRILKTFLRNIIYENQYGFREKRSTQHAIIDIVNQIQTNMDKNMYTCGIFIDLQKAFDTVIHSILLQKLQHYGICGIINDWFSSYLLNRIQTTKIGTVVSDKETVLSGVPQGSVLGPLLDR